MPMKFVLYASIALSAAWLLVSAPVSAHHEITAKFDPNKATTLRGIVTKVDWANPHAHIFFNVQTGNRLANWAAELESTVDLSRAGWTRETLKPGDTISVQGPVARDGSRQIWGNNVTLADGNKRVFDMAAAKPRPMPA